jgi:hypothetical protein
MFVLEPPTEPTTPQFKPLLEDDGFIETKRKDIIAFRAGSRHIVERFK